MVKSVIKNIFKAFSNLKLIQKLLVSYFLLIIIPLALFSFLLCSNVTTIIENYVFYSAKQSFEQADSFLTYKFYNILEKSNVLLNNNLFVEIMSSDPSSDLPEQVKNSNDLSLMLTSLENEVDIKNVKLYISDDFIYSKDSKNIFGINSIKNTEWYSILMKSQKNFLWSPSAWLDKDDVLAYSKKIFDPNDYSKYVGTIRFDFPRQDIVNILSKANTINDSLSYILCSDGDIFAASSQSLLNKYDIDQGAFLKYLQDDEWATATYNQEKVLVTYRLIKNTDLYMVNIIPFESLVRESRKIRNFALVLLIIISTIAYAFAYFISYSITKKINLLATKMRDIHNGKLLLVDIPHGNDEIGGLIDDYNFMTGKLSELIKEQYMSGQRLKNSELRVLQAQINPHFLYNTLDMINWYALKNSGSEIVTIVESLAKFYKLSLNKGSDLIPLKDELTHVQSYFKIQQFRYKHIELNVIVSEDLLDLTILKIIIQPIVENAILHGILCKESKSGTVNISVQSENDLLIIKITDDGIGITPEKLEKVFTSNVESKTGSSFGVRNTQERIQLHYGSEYGLKYSSEIGIGTTVEIRIPSNIP
jgi:Predicted signal transduction protein with a C-terminal ATPase domain